MNGIDGNKKIKGIKRHVVVDKNGFLIAVMVTVANINDSKAANLLMRVLKELCSVKTIIADGGYRDELAENIRNTFGYVLQVVISGYQKQGFRPIKKRWVVEHVHSIGSTTTDDYVGIMKQHSTLQRRWSKLLL